VVTRQEALEVITRRELPEGCAFGPCVSAVATPLGVDQILDVRVGAVGQSYSFVLTLVEGKSGAPLAQVVGSCAVCTVAEALTKVADAVAVLEGGRNEPSSNLVAHKPPGASPVPPILVTALGAAGVGASALLVSRSDRDALGWTVAGAGGALVLTGVTWLLLRD
jgi:hypothetical protein